MWGLKVDQPFSQVKFESGVKNAINSIIQEYPVLSVFQNYPNLAGNIGRAYIVDNIDIRPKMFDKAAGLWLLIDTGAAVCVWPKKRFPQAQVDTTVKLQALNKSRFQTYGTQDIVFKINNKAYTHSVLIVDVDQPILGFDFIWRYKISIIWNRHGKLDLADMKSDVSAPLTVHKVPEGTSIKLAPV